MLWDVYWGTLNCQMPINPSLLIKATATTVFQCLGFKFRSQALADTLIPSPKQPETFGPEP